MTMHDVSAEPLATKDANVALTGDEPIIGGGRTQRRWASSKLIVNAARLVLVVAVLLTWQLLADHGALNKAFSSTPTDVWHALSTYFHSGQLRVSTVSTMQAVAWAFVIGTVLGTFVGFVLGLSPFLNKVLGVFLVPLNSVPRIALAPLFILWFGLTSTAKVALAVTIVFFVLAVNARAAVAGLDPDIVTMARVNGVHGRSFMTKILLPASIPAVFAGVRLAITYSLLGVVASEMIAARSGLGQDIVRFSSSFDVASVFAVLLELALIATVINAAFELLERRLLRWQHQ